jgi:hypothetical protein
MRVHTRAHAFVFIYTCISGTKRVPDGIKIDRLLFFILLLLLLVRKCALFLSRACARTRDLNVVLSKTFKLLLYTNPVVFDLSTTPVFSANLPRVPTVFFRFSGGRGKKKILFIMTRAPRGHIQRYCHITALYPKTRVRGNRPVSVK